MHVFFSIGLLASYRFMFFFIDWKLPPPACPGTSGIFIYFLFILDIFFADFNFCYPVCFDRVALFFFSIVLWY